MADAPAVEVEALAIRRGGTPVIDDATFRIGPGLWLLHGPNGSGKSTLLRVLAGVGAAAAGRVRICGHDLQSEPVEARRRLGYAPQSAELFGYLTVREFLETVAALRATPVEPSLARARTWVHERCEAQRIDTLSAGQRRKLCLCAALSGTPTVLLLDEPEAGLDRAALQSLRDELASLADTGHTIVLASHSDAGAPRHGSGTLRVSDGQVRLGRERP